MTQRRNHQPDQQKPENTENPWLEAFKTLALSAVLAFGIRTFVAEARYIPSGSMLPTLEIDDRLIIEKISKHFRQLERGDIVVFIPPDDATTICLGPAQASRPRRRDAYIKRVIGLPGETIEVRNGKVFIDGQQLSEKYIQEAPEYIYGPKTIPAQSFLVLGDNRNNSCDSHSWDFVARENIIGRAVVRFWPMGRVGSLYEEPLYPSAN